MTITQMHLTGHIYTGAFACGCVVVQALGRDLTPPLHASVLHRGTLARLS